MEPTFPLKFPARLRKRRASRHCAKTESCNQGSLRALSRRSMAASSAPRWPPKAWLSPPRRQRPRSVSDEAQCSNFVCRRHRLPRSPPHVGKGSSSNSSGNSIRGCRPSAAQRQKRESLRCGQPVRIWPSIGASDGFETRRRCHQLLSKSKPGVLERNSERPSLRQLSGNPPSTHNLRVPD